MRTRLADAAGVDPDTAHEIATDLLEELERARMREAVLRVEHANLVAAARAALAAADEGDTAPFIYLEDELHEHGQRPTWNDPSEHILADGPVLPDSAHVDPEGGLV